MIITVKWKDLPTALKMKDFYVGWFLSFWMTMGLIYVIHLVTMYLDRRYDWRINPKKRSLWQGLLGALVPGVAETVMVSGYMMIMIENFDLAEFIVKDVPWIFLFIVLVNIIYAVHFLNLTAPKMVEQEKPDVLDTPDALETTLELTEQKRSQPADPDKPEQLIIRYGPKTFRLNATEDILYFQRSDKALLVATKDRIINYGEKSIVQMQEMYKDKGFCQINRAVSINMRTVKDVARVKRENYKITFHNPDDIPNAESSDLWVTQHFLENFQQLLESKTYDVHGV